MIITKTPHRISFFGGGTDYPSWYLKNGGKVLGAAIDKYCYLIVRELPPFFEHKHRIVYSRMENVSSIEEIAHPSVKAVLKRLKYQKGISIHHDGDIPARSGMGSSSAFTVGLLNAMYTLEGRAISKDDLGELAIDVEQNDIRENVGSQDQIFAAHGGFNRVEFLPSREIVVSPVVMKPENARALEQRLMLVFTGLSRNASDIAQEQIANVGRNASELARMAGLVDEAYSLITAPKPDLPAFGRLLNETWRMKRALSSKISSSHIDGIHEAALKAGAEGGKLLGAGGGGFMLFSAEPERQAKVREALKGLLLIPFKFEYFGSQIIYYSHGAERQ